MAKQYRRPHRGFTPAAKENIRHRVENTNEPISSIAADYGCHRKTIDTLTKAEGWVMRKDRGPRDVPSDLILDLEAEQAVHAVAEASIAGEQVSARETGQAEEREAQPPTRFSIADRLERAVEKELAAVEIKRARLGSEPQASEEAERTSRILERMTDTLFKIRRLRSPDLSDVRSTDFDDIPGDIDEFRNQLAQRIRTFVQSRLGEALPATGEPPDGVTSH